MLPLANEDLLFECTRNLMTLILNCYLTVQNNYNLFDQISLNVREDSVLEWVAWLMNPGVFPENVRQYTQRLTSSLVFRTRPPSGFLNSLCVQKIYFNAACVCFINPTQKNALLQQVVSGKIKTWAAQFI